MRVLATKTLSSVAVRRSLFLASLLLVMTLLAAGPAAAFEYIELSDVDSSPYYEPISALSTRGVISGFQDGTFRPEAPVLRAQFAKMIIAAWGDRPVEVPGSRFTDLGHDDPNSLYPHQYVYTAVHYGVVRGKTPSLFDPWSNISRAQVITMLVRFAEAFANPSLPKPPAHYRSTWGNFDPTHAENVRVAEFNGYLEGLPLGKGEGLGPWAPMPRGEVAQILYNYFARLSGMEYVSVGALEYLPDETYLPVVVQVPGEVTVVGLQRQTPWHSYEVRSVYRGHEFLVTVAFSTYFTGYEPDRQRMIDLMTETPTPAGMGRIRVYSPTAPRGILEEFVAGLVYRNQG